MSFDPRGALPHSTMSFPRRYHSQILQSSRRSFSQLPTRSKTRKSQIIRCYDWIFSSATNVHIAIDRSSFNNITPFDSHVLTVAGSSPIPVRGIGSIDLKVRCKPSSHQSRIITLENVLYVPSWICNIISDTYFDSASFEHKWTDTGLRFTKRTDKKVKAWCYTEPFCGLDKLALSKEMTGRSPMMEDKDREIWSVNLNWPQSQKDKWNAFKSRELQRVAKEHEIEILAQQQAQQGFTQSTELLLPKNQGKSPNPKLKSGSTISPSKVSIRSHGKSSMAQVMAQMESTRLEEGDMRMSLSEISTNIPVRRESDNRVGSLKATFNANRGLLKDFLAVGGKG